MSHSFQTSTNSVYSLFHFLCYISTTFAQCVRYFNILGTSNIYCDVNVLDTSRLARSSSRTELDRGSNQLHWLEESFVKVEGKPPQPRYGHSAVAIDRETIAIFGGVASEPMPLDEIYILTLNTYSVM